MSSTFQYKPAISVEGKKICCHKTLFHDLAQHVANLKQIGFKEKTFQEKLQEIASLQKEEQGQRKRNALQQLIEMQRKDASKLDWFWLKVKQIDWARDMNVEKTKTRYDALDMTDKEKKDLFDIAGMYYQVLDSLMEYMFGFCVPTPGADDSYSDYVWSAVGQGKEYYENLFSDFNLWDSKEVNRITEESFSYVIDSESDRE